MVVMKYRKSKGDHTFLIKNLIIGNVTTLIVYVDNIIIIRDYLKEVEWLKKYLIIEFEIKDLGKLKYFLAIEVAYSKNNTFVSQQKWIF